jgi:hypothetical protein
VLIFYLHQGAGRRQSVQVVISPSERFDGRGSQQAEVGIRYIG